MRLPQPPRPGGPFRPEVWRSPLRGPWLSSFLGSLLLALMTVCALTGLASHLAYDPWLGDNAIVPAAPLGIGLPDIAWPTSPAWLYVVTQGLHVVCGLIAAPILLAKLWSVMPKLFEWPPADTLGHAIERLTLAGLVGGALFTLGTGIMNIQVWYPWEFSFVPAHVYASIIFVACLALHVGLKAPLVLRSFRSRGVFGPLGADLAATRPEPAEPGTTAPVAPLEPTVSRRGLLGAVGAGSALLGVMGTAQVIGGPLRPLALLAPRSSNPVGDGGPNDFQINKTAASVGLGSDELGSGWRLELTGARSLSLSREDLETMEQRTERLPIACVEGWSTTQEWTGVPLADLAALAGMPEAGEVFVESLQESGAFRSVTLSSNAIADERSLLALGVNGAELSADHGYPARIIVPALPGVHCTKWVARMTFAEAA